MKANIISFTEHGKRFLALYRDYMYVNKTTMEMRCHCIDTETGELVFKYVSLNQEMDNTVFDLTLVGKLVTETKLVPA